jgi:predicted lipoprotein with Yx(FWY)xxD motif
MRTSAKYVMLLMWLVTADQGSAQSAAPKTLKTAVHAELGAYLTDGSDMALYMFEEDRRGGDRGRAVETDCVAECLGNWGPFFPEVPPKMEGDVNSKLVSSFKRPDGKLQATYNGWPLYYFHEDFGPGDTNGHDVEEFGGEWYLLSPAGTPIGEPDEH